MDIQTFIQSGLLESYILGQCTADELVLVERMAVEHPEVRAELESIETALENYATAQAITPPVDLRERIMRSIDAQAASTIPNVGAPVTQPASWPPAPGFMWLLVAALGVLAVYLLFKVNKAQQENAALQTQVATLTAEKNDCATRTQHNERVFALLRDKQNTRRIELEVAANQKVYFYQNTALGETSFDGTGMVSAPAHRYFQLWALMPNNQPPKDLGMFDLNAPEHWQHLDHYKEAIGFAISLEDDPKGHPVPTVVLKADTKFVSG